VPVDPTVKEQLRLALAPSGGLGALTELLLQNSKLPGPRANLELVDLLANASADRTDLIDVYRAWLDVESGPNEPAVFLPTCAAVALGAVFPAASSSDRAGIVSALQSSAEDARWRVREGVAMGLQRIGEASFADLEAILRGWIDEGSLLKWRAVVAALAHPAILRDPNASVAAVDMAGAVALRATTTPTGDRKSEEFKALKQGLSYALSVIVAARPTEGFALVKRLAATGDPDAIAIVEANLDKPRLTKPFPDEVARVRSLI